MIVQVQRHAGRKAGERPVHFKVSAHTGLRAPNNRIQPKNSLCALPPRMLAQGESAEPR